MHSRIFELSQSPVPEDDRYTYDCLPEWFYGQIADYSDDIPDENRSEEIRWFASSFAGACTCEGGKLTFAPDTVERYFRQAYSKFLAAAAQLTAYSYEAFCGKNGWRVLDHTVFELNDAYEDRYGFYVYDRDRSEFRTEDAWLREADLSAPWYVGGIVDYHF